MTAPATVADRTQAPAVFADGARRGTLAYVMAASLKPGALAEIATGRQPRPEYVLFLQRNQATLLDVRVAERSTHPVTKLLRRINQPGWALAVEARRARPAYDAFLATGEDIGLPLATLARLDWRRRPVYVITHGSFFASSKFRLAMKLVRGVRTVHFLCLSETIRQKLIGEFGVPASQVHNTSYATDTEFFSGAEPSPVGSPPVIASVGAANRDYRTLVRAAALLTTPFELRVAADSAWFPMSVDIAGDELPPYVHVGSYDYTHLRELYARARFVVVPLYAGEHACGYSAIIEAMAMSRPVIATRTNCYSDFIVDGETGFYVRPGDAEGLRDRMAYLLAHPDVAQAMGESARRRAALFSEEAYVKRIESVIAAGGYRSPASRPVTPGIH